MPRKQKLKVYRTPIGFHDAYVAAPSQKAALEAWGAEVDLFARGVAEAVQDEKLTQAPLEKPGMVVRVARGSSAEHLAALTKDKPAQRKAPPPAVDEGPPPRRSGTSKARRPSRRTGEESEATELRTPAPAPKPKSRARPKPRPSRARLDDAERTLETAEADHQEAITQLREQEKALQRKRRDLEERHEAEISRLEAKIAKARESYGAALEKWRT